MMRLLLILLLLVIGFLGFAQEQFQLRKIVTKKIDSTKRFYRRNPVQVLKLAREVEDRAINRAFTEALKHIETVLNDPTLKVDLFMMPVTQRKGLDVNGIVDIIRESISNKMIYVIIGPIKHRKTLGFSGKGSNMIIIKQAVFNNGPKAVARVLVHEYCHILGFRHEVPFIKRTSVPYRLGDLVGR